MQGYKYRYPGGKSTKVPFTLSKPEEEEDKPGATASISEPAEVSVPTAT